MMKKYLIHPTCYTEEIYIGQRFRIFEIEGSLQKQ